jgi:RNA polymerase sigma factor (sigma-70 family)
MEAGTVPRITAPRMPALTPRLIRLASDARLVAFVREGRPGGFEAIYDRHHRAILSFCRHLLGDQHEAEDAVQHTFMAAYSSLLSSQRPIHLRPWLFTIARNRCYSVLRAQRERPTAELDEAVTEGLPSEVQRRQDLRDLVSDLRRLPEEQRAAIVLAELDSLSHADIAEVLEIPRDKVKALVFQARESLLASRTARDTSCHEIRIQLAAARGGALRRSNLRRHLRDCEGCRAYRASVQRQRGQFAALLPVAPTLLLKEGLVTAALGAGGVAAVGGSGLIASSALKTGFLKGLAAALMAGAGTVGTVVVSASDLPVRALSSGSGSAHATTLRTAGPAVAHHAHSASAKQPAVTATGAYVSTPVAHTAASRTAVHHRLAGTATQRHVRSVFHGHGAKALPHRGAQHALRPYAPAKPVHAGWGPTTHVPPGHAVVRISSGPFAAPGLARKDAGNPSPGSTTRSPGFSAHGQVRMTPRLAASARAAGAASPGHAHGHAGFTPPGHADGRAGSTPAGHATKHGAFVPPGQASSRRGSGRPGHAGRAAKGAGHGQGRLHF